MTTSTLPFVLAETAEPQPGDPARLAGSHCPTCLRSEFPPRNTCPVCATTMADEQHGPDAVLGAYTAVLHPPPGGLVDPPYVIGEARFESGISVLGRIMGRPYEALGRDLALVCELAAVGETLGYAFRVVER